MQHRTYKNILTTVAAFLMLAVAGCQTRLAPSGAYNQDMLLYSTDLAITTTYEIVHDFVKWEYNNRAALSGVPEIKKAADRMRQEIPGLINSAITLRDVYEQEPSVVNRDSLTNVLKLLRAAALEATKILVENQN